MLRAAVLFFGALQACSSSSRAPATAPEKTPATTATVATQASKISTEPDPATDVRTLDAESNAAYPDHEDELIDDGGESDGSALAPSAPPPHPLDGKSSSDLEALMLDDPAALGSMSLGSPNAGGLFNGVRMPERDAWVLVDPSHAWGTRETVDFIAHSIEAVNRVFPATPPLHIGHISAERGGRLSPHVSHQAGRDVDLGYYYVARGRWYARADASNLDRARSWALVRAFIVGTDAELILIDVSIQKLLEQHAREIGEDSAWLDAVFRGVPGKLPPLIRHAQGHATHLHVRFWNPVAQETARRLLETMIRQKKIEAPMTFVRHKVKNGETLGMLARKYRTTVRAIQRANGLRSTKIRAKRVYLIPRPGPVKLSSRPVSIPPRRLPRDKSTRPGAELPHRLNRAESNRDPVPILLHSRTPRLPAHATGSAPAPASPAFSPRSPYRS